MRFGLPLIALIPGVVIAQTISCPTTLPENSVQVARVPAGWEASASAPVRLDGGGMLSGNPKQMQYLVPARSKKIKDGGASTWDFEPGEEKWLYCTYGRMAVQLSKRMDDAATVCEISSLKDQGGGIAQIKAVCR